MHEFQIRILALDLPCGGAPAAQVTQDRREQLRSKKPVEGGALPHPKVSTQTHAARAQYRRIVPYHAADAAASLHDALIKWRIAHSKSTILGYSCSSDLGVRGLH